VVTQVIDNSDRAGMLARAVLTRAIRSEALWRLGRWSESLAQMSHLMSLQQATSQTQLGAVVAAVLARLEAGFGHDQECRRWAAATPPTPGAPGRHPPSARGGRGPGLAGRA